MLYTKAESGFSLWICRSTRQAPTGVEVFWPGLWMCHQVWHDRMDELDMVELRGDPTTVYQSIHYGTSTIGSSNRLDRRMWIGRSTIMCSQ